MQRGLRGLAGQPNKPYIDFSTYAGCDIWLDLQFLDRTRTPAVPASAQYRIDNLSSHNEMLGNTPITIVPLQTEYTVNIPGSVNVMLNNIMSSQVCQVLVTAIYPDSSTTKRVYIYELVSINTTGGQ